MLTTRDHDDYADVEIPLSKNIQEQLLALLCFDRKYGAKVAAILTAETFDGTHAAVAKAVFRYRRKYSRPPHRDTASLIERLTLREEQRRTANEIYAKMLGFRKHMNKEFVLKQASVYRASQQLKNTLAEATQMYLRKDSVIETSAYIIKTLRQPITDAVKSIDLSIPEQSLGYKDQDLSGYLLGIAPFDKHGLRLKPGTLTLYMGAKNSGKSWFCVHAARSACEQQANVLHVTLEMSANEVSQRYHQAFLHIASKESEYQFSKLRHNKFGQIIDWEAIVRRTENDASYFSEDLPGLRRFGRYGMTVENPNFKKWIEAQENIWKEHWQRIRIVEFPTSTLTIAQLENYLGFLAADDDPFVPDVLIIDYPDLMKLSTKEYRLDLGVIVQELRGVSIQRKCAVVAPTQVNRIGMDSKELKGTHIAEDVSKLNTADTVLAYSQTSTEEAANLARLKLLYSRTGQRGIEVVMSQNYTLGQYVVDAKRMGVEYMAKVMPSKKKGEDMTGRLI